MFKNAEKKYEIKYLSNPKSDRQRSIDKHGVCHNLFSKKPKCSRTALIKMLVEVLNELAHNHSGDISDKYTQISFAELNPVICTESLSPKLTKIISDSRHYVFEYNAASRIDLDEYVTLDFHPRFVVGIPQSKIVLPKTLSRYGKTCLYL